MADARQTWINELVDEIQTIPEVVESSRRLKSIVDEQYSQPYVGIHIDVDQIRVKDSTHVRKLSTCTLYILTAEDQVSSEKMIKLINDKIETLTLTGVKKIWVDSIRGPYVEDPNKDPYAAIEIDLSVIWVALRSAY